MTSLGAAWQALGDSQHRARFYRLWRTGTGAGFTVVRSLEVMGPGERSSESCRLWLMDGLRAGRSLASVVRGPGTPFTGFEAGLLALGDESGRLEAVLGLLADHHDREHRAMLAVRKRLVYPLCIATLAIVIAPLSLLLFGHARSYVALVAGLLGGLWMAGGAVVDAAVRRIRRNPRLVRARLARAIAIGIEAGLPSGASLRLAAGSCGDPEVARHVARLGERRLSTQPLRESLAGCRAATPEFLAVLANAERTGDFTGTLTRLAALYEEDG